jgi:A/G-specific adenine glycosylase
VHRAQPQIAPTSPPHPALIDPLLTWFTSHARPLPWRRTRDPYAIWISEIMLQQTQVDAVIPYYERWMRRLPTLASLANAPPALPLKLWAGLGYYRRVRHLHAAARLVLTQSEGRFPHDYHKVLELPGIGHYTAGAICSIAFNQPTPILDGNVMRVLTRLFALPGDPRAQPLNAILWEFSKSLVESAAIHGTPRSRPCGRLNQALMELGALVCTPKSPHCNVCPLQTLCLAFRMGHPTSFPSSRFRATTTRRFAVFLLRHDSRILIRRQLKAEWNAGLWGFPAVEIEDESYDSDEICRRQLGVHPRPCTRLGQVRHAITRYRLLLDVHQADLDDQPRPARPGERWCRPENLTKFALAGAHRKILRLAGV